MGSTAISSRREHFSTLPAIEALKKAGLDHVQISVQAPNEALADEIAGTRAHARKLEALKRVQDAGFAVTLNCVLHRANHDGIAEVIALAERCGIERLELANVQFYGWAHRNRGALMPTRAQVEHGRVVVEEARSRLGSAMQITYVLPDYFGDRPKPCMSGWAREFMTVTPDGRVLPCPAAAGIRTLQFDSVRERSLGDIWRNSAAFEKYRGTGWMPQPCRSCDRREIDWGGCRCQAYLLTGDMPEDDGSGLCAQSRPCDRRRVARITRGRPTSTPAHDRVIIRVLGSAAGGGVPQWNCACTNCSAVRDGRRPLRTQSSFALSADGERWYLVNISPDIASQIERYAPLQPRSTRGTPIAGVLLTDANVDHMGGLTVVRQQGDHRFVLRSSAVVREIALRQAAFAPFAEPPHRWRAIDDAAVCAPEFDDDPVGGALEIRAVFVPGLTPGFDGRHATPGAVVAYEVHDRRSGGRAVFAPVFSGTNRALIDALERADVAFLDGSFFTDDELPGLGLGEKTARALGHQPAGGADGTLAAVAALKNRRVFAHLNNSNPMLDPDSLAALAVAETGAEVAYDGMELRL